VFRIMLTILLAGLTAIPCNAEFRDPTQPAYQLPAPAANDAGGDTELVLSAIWISSQSRRATINGILAKQGQTIDIGQTSALNNEPASTATPSDKNDIPLKPSAMDTTPSYVIPTPDSIPPLKPAHIAARPNTIKIISIHKNSVTITQNGELKTLQLVQRPYKIQ